MKTGTELITEERKRQIEKEGWDSEHDDNHDSMPLAVSAASYILDVSSKHANTADSWKRYYKEASKELWPFDSEWFKPTPEDPIKQLTKAGALIAAEIDRIQRLNQ